MTLAARLAIGVVRGYQLALRPVLGCNCRFDPSCSEYAAQALARHGVARGGMMAGRRILRCNPWHAGGDDPVPPLADAATDHANQANALLRAADLREHA